MGVYSPRNTNGLGKGTRYSVRLRTGDQCATKMTQNAQFIKIRRRSIRGVYDDFPQRLRARVNRVMSSWQSHSSNDVLASWGPPAQVFDDGSGGRVLVWSASHSVTTPVCATTRTTGTATINGNTVWGSATSRTMYNPGNTCQWRSYRIFWVSKNGVIHRWAWRGL